MKTDLELVKSELTILVDEIGTIVNPIAEKVEGFEALGGFEGLPAGLMKVADDNGREISFKNFRTAAQYLGRNHLFSAIVAATAMRKPACNFPDQGARQVVDYS